MFVLITIIIFGIFVVIVYWLFEDRIQDMLNNMVNRADTIVTENLDNVGGHTPVPPAP